MPRQIIEVGNRIYTVSPEDEFPIAGRLWAVASAHLIDEITQEPVTSETTVEIPNRGLYPKVSPDGVVSLIGRPWHLFPALAVQSYSVEFLVRATGYSPRILMALLDHTDPLNTGFPDSFGPAGVSASLHRLPVSLHGRVVRDNGGGTTPASNALIRVAGFWPNPRLAQAAPPPAQPPDLVFMDAPLYSDREIALTTVRRRSLAGAGPAKILLNSVSPGESLLSISDQAGLSPGIVLHLDPSDRERSELVVVDSISGSSDPSLPADMQLSHALHRAHKVGAEASPLTPQAAGGNRSLTREGFAHDSNLFLDSVAGLSHGDVLEIAGGTDPAEYHAIRLAEETCDTEGYYRLPPLSRIAELQLEITDGLNSLTPELSLNYSRREHRIDFIIRP